MHYLITGGAGFIGSHLADSLLKDQHQVTIIDNLSTGRIENLREALQNPQCHFIQGDLETLPELPTIIKKVDAVFHLAAAVGVELVLRQPLQTMRTNLQTTERLLSYVAQEKKPLILASTSEVYGTSSKDKFAETDHLIMGEPTHSRWCYAASKAMDEFFAFAYAQEYQTPITIVRFFNIVGPRQIGHYGMVLPRLINQAINNQPLRVFGNGQQSRCFCHVQDAVSALCLLITSPQAQGQIFNIGTEEAVTIEALAQRIIAISGSSSCIELVPYKQAYSYPGFEEMFHRTPDTSKIQKMISWRPNFSLNQIIEATLIYCSRSKQSEM